MKKRNILVVLLILLLIICAMSYIFILADNTHKINNDSIFNNSTNLQNKQNDKNISLNNTNNTNNVEGNINNNYYKQSSSNNNHNCGHDKNNSNDSFDEALEAKLDVERNVHLEKNEIVGYPVYKHPRLNAWLVPTFDKYTKEFLGSVYVCGEPGYHYYVNGPEFYSEYKQIISGKYKYKPTPSNEADEINRVPDYTERYVLAAVNPEVKDNYPSSNIPLDTQSESVVELDLNQYYPAESNETA
ncbi:hypothetical protein [uncultured Methanobrevibacter sp.]|uniref:hypothetical protein n=1 Tax=uncultured Methanobrevibacter sp. TaxID=253161 RepID=UPI0025EBC589|nr:hypothetical protein [uncultured Methanobrevibacter sp.]